MTTRSSEACDPPVRCLWKMKMVSHRHSYRCSCEDLRVYPRECNKVNKPFFVGSEYCFVILHSFVYHMCEFIILTHILQKNRCDRSSVD
jgi:hypothetical protein